MDKSDSTKSHVNYRPLSTHQKCYDFLQSNEILAANNNLLRISGPLQSAQEDYSYLSKHLPSSSLTTRSNFLSYDDGTINLNISPLHKIQANTRCIHTGTNLSSTLSSRIRSYSNTSRSDHESSNTSSSGISSGLSCNSNKSDDSNLSEIDFSIGFEDKEEETPNLDDIDGEDGQILQKSADTLTIIGNENSIDKRIADFEDLLIAYDNDDDDDDDSSNSGKQTSGFLNSLNSSTNTLYAEHFSLFTEGEDQEANGICRSNSLKIVQPTDKKFSEKAPRKVVRFADVMGLDLESIRYMTPPDMSVTSSTVDYIKLRLEQLNLHRTNIGSSSISSLNSIISDCKKPILYLVSKSFTPPSNIVQQVYERQVVLECLYTKDISAYGTVRVTNCSFDKKVFVRYTCDRWKTYDDSQAMHNLHNSNDNTDSFTFELTIPETLLTDDISSEQNMSIFFTICYQVMGREYWDNNFGWNYILDICER
ncbi:unnamed protein product, partial [Didymodactylos carnosus]